ncbi:hypothetical protein [Paenibacillus sp. MBLB4367]|uniref:hypothetical protein n=1 Tax=Paenibacillus sp. MBLB4367 TaxID=3384767 RepID=UPI003908396B
MEKWNSPVPCCERCGRNNRTAAHMENASQLGPGNVPWNVCNLCGTHGTKGCHDWADNTRDGIEWKMKKRTELLEYYAAEGRKWAASFQTEIEQLMGKETGP